MFRWAVGRKLGMSQLFDSDGKVVPVTVVKLFDVELVTRDQRIVRNGVELVRVDLTIAAESDELSGYSKKKTLWVSDAAEASLAELRRFSVSDSIKVRGISKGRGFAGTIKRHNFRGGPAAHGSKSHRLPGSIGAGTSPSEVVKGKKMPGRMGGDYVTMKGLRVFRVNEDAKLVFVRGSVPGCNGSVVELVGGKA